MEFIMKKIILLICFIFIFLLVGCETNNKYIEKISVPNEVSEAFYLPAVVTNDGKHDIYWKSSNPDVLKISNNNMTEIDGLMHYKVTVNRVSVDVKVNLTMTLEVIGEEPIVKEYDVTVLKMNQEEQETIQMGRAAIQRHGIPCEGQG